MRGRELVLALALVALEAYWWAAPAVVAFQITTPQGLGRLLGVTFGLLLLAFATSQGLQRTALSLWWQRGIAVIVALGGGGVIALGLGAPLWQTDWWQRLLDRGSPMGLERAVAIALVVGGIVLWWRGVHLAQSRRDYDTVLLSCLLGLVVVAGSAITTAVAGVGAAVEALVFPFFLLGLVALALARLGQVGYGKELTFGGYWLMVLTAMVVAVVGLGGWVQMLWAQERGTLPGPVPLPFADFWASLLYRVLVLLFLPMELLINLLRSLLLRPIPFFREGLSGFVEGLQDEVTNKVLLPEGMVLFMKVTAAILGVLLMLWLLGLALQRWRREGQRPEAEERASIWSPSLFVEDLTSLLQSLLGGFHPHQARSAREVDRWAQGSWEVRVLFALYRDLLATAEQRGHPRRLWETPCEFQEAMERELRWATARPITAAFVQARYGFIAPSHQEVLQLQRLWEITKAGTQTGGGEAKALAGEAQS